MRGYLKKKNTAKAERVFAEEMKRNRIHFQAKVKVNGFEVDFLIDRLAIEINGHPQKIEKNKMLLESGLIPINITNKEVLDNRTEIAKKIICLNKME